MLCCPWGCGNFYSLRIFLKPTFLGVLNELLKPKHVQWCVQLNELESHGHIRTYLRFVSPCVITNLFILLLFIVNFNTHCT